MIVRIPLLTMNMMQLCEPAEQRGHGIAKQEADKDRDTKNAEAQKAKDKDTKVSVQSLAGTIWNMFEAIKDNEEAKDIVDLAFKDKEDTSSEKHKHIFNLEVKPEEVFLNLDDPKEERRLR